MTLINARTPEDIIDVIRAEWPEVDYCKCTQNELADLGTAMFHAQTDQGHDRYFVANVCTDTITRRTQAGTIKETREF